MSASTYLIAWLVCLGLRAPHRPPWWPQLLLRPHRRRTFVFSAENPVTFAVTATHMRNRDRIVAHLLRRRIRRVRRLRRLVHCFYVCMSL